MIRTDSGDFVELSRIVVSIDFSEMRLTSNFHYQLLRILLYVHVEISLVKISGHTKAKGKEEFVVRPRHNTWVDFFIWHSFSKFFLQNYLFSVRGTENSCTNLWEIANISWSTYVYISLWQLGLPLKRQLVN